MQAVVGVYIGQSQIRNLRNQKPHLDYHQLVKANRKAGTTLYFFSLQGVNMTRKTIKGMYYNEEKDLWEVDRFPYPDAIYKRGSAAESSRKARRFLKQVKVDGIKPLNKLSSYNKWKVYNCLKKCPDVKKYLPLTVGFDRKTLKDMLDQYGTVYLKAQKGRLGLQVMRVQLLNGYYVYSYFNEKLYSSRTASYGNLLKRISRFFNGRKIIAQEGIDVITVDGCNIDFRAEVQRNGSGEVEVAAVAARMGGSGSPITTHSSAFKFDEFLRENLNYNEDKINDLKNNVDLFLKQVYSCLENAYGPLGETGIDFAIDKKGKIKFIECNARSTKKSVSIAYDEETFLKLYLNLLDYANYLKKEALSVNN